MRTLEETITKNSRSSFYYTFLFLPKEKKHAMNVVYAFCRITDDIVDVDNVDLQTKIQNLDEWEFELNKAFVSKSKFEILNHLVEVISKLKLSHQTFFDLIKGVRMDLTKNRFNTFEELKTYCMCVASTIGQMSIEIYGYRNQKSRDYALNLGVAMQITNILRDLKLDAEKNRIYIPKEDLEKFGYSENDLLNSVYNQNFIRLMEFQMYRAEYYYNQADLNFTREDAKVLAMGRAMQDIYFSILKKIKRKNFNVFEYDCNIPRIKKIFITLYDYLRYNIISV